VRYVAVGFVVAVCGALLAFVAFWMGWLIFNLVFPLIAYALG